MMAAAAAAAARRWTVLSGIQPTGVPHVGNYLGALQTWVALQAQHDVLYMIADLHALTVPPDPATLRRQCVDMAASLLACGLDPARSRLFAQSTVPEHAELAWVLTCHTPVGWLRRMTQWKVKRLRGIWREEERERERETRGERGGVERERERERERDFCVSACLLPVLLSMVVVVVVVVCVCAWEGLRMLTAG
jgi:tryptophanyl-tRNA synthetase